MTITSLFVSPRKQLALWIMTIGFAVLLGTSQIADAATITYTTSASFQNLGLGTQFFDFDVTPTSVVTVTTTFDNAGLQSPISDSGLGANQNITGATTTITLTDGIRSEQWSSSGQVEILGNNIPDILVWATGVAGDAWSKSFIYTSTSGGLSPDYLFAPTSSGSVFLNDNVFPGRLSVPFVNNFSATVAVPEPASLGLLGVAGLALLSGPFGRRASHKARKAV